MNANKQGAGGEVTNPDNVGGLFYPSGDDVDQMIELAIQCGIDNRGTSWPVTLCRLRAKVRAELCRAAPAGGDCRGTIPQALNETINGVVSDLEMIAAGKDLVTGDPVSGLQSQRIAKSAHAILLAAWNACDSAPSGGVLDGSLQHKLAQELDSAPAGSGEVLPNGSATLLRAMVRNYRDGHCWDHLDAKACTDAADLIDALLRKLQQGAECFVREMRTSKGSEFFVVVRCNGRELTPHMYTERWKAEYDVASWQHLLSGAPEPDILAYGPASQGQEGGTNG